MRAPRLSHVIHPPPHLHLEPKTLLRMKGLRGGERKSVTLFLLLLCPSSSLSLLPLPLYLCQQCWSQLFCRGMYLCSPASPWQGKCKVTAEHVSKRASSSHVVSAAMVCDWHPSQVSLLQNLLQTITNPEGLIPQGDTCSCHRYLYDMLNTRPQPPIERSG